MGRSLLAWFALILIAATARLFAAAWWHARIPQGEAFGLGDSKSYWQLGQRLAAGEPYQFGPDEARIFRTPGYPLSLAPLFLVGGKEIDPWWGRCLGVVWGVWGVCWIGAFARKVDTPLAGWITSLLAAIYPGIVIMSALVLSEGLYCVFLIWQWSLWLPHWQRPAQEISSRRSAIGSLAIGVLAACGTMIRPSHLLLTPLALACGAIWNHRNLRPWLTHACLVLIGLALGMAPWWIRNAFVSGHFVPTTLQIGASLYDGLRPDADGSSDMRFVETFRSELRKEKGLGPQDAIPSSWEYDLDESMKHAAWDWATQNPAAACRLAGIKFLRMWNIWPNEAAFRSPTLKAIVAISYLPVGLLALACLWLLRGQRLLLLFLLLPAIYYTLLHMVFVSSLRYREPAMFFGLVLAAVAIERFMPARLRSAFVPVPSKVEKNTNSPTRFQRLDPRPGFGFVPQGVGP